MTNLSCFIAALISYAVFVSRFAWHGLLWFRNPANNMSYSESRSRNNSAACVSTLIDILFFRRMFNNSKMLWVFSWAFHLSFFFVVLRHLRYFFPSLPDCLILLQPVGLFAGYLLPVSLFFLVLLRTVKRKNRYVSLYNYSISAMLLLISLSGVFMRTVFRADMPGVKEFSTGIFSLTPQPFSGGMLLLMHGSLFLLLLPFLPTHILAAPFVTFEANRRNRELRSIIHDA